MPAGHVLAQVQAQQATQTSTRDDFEDAGIERRETQNVSDLQQTASAFRRLHDPQTVGRVGGNRLLEEHVVASSQGGERRLDVELVSGGDDGEWRLPRPIQQGLPVFEERCLGEIVLPAHCLAAADVGLGDGHHPKPIRVAESKGPIGVPAAKTGAEHHCFERVHAQIYYDSSPPFREEVRRHRREREDHR